MDVSFLLLTVQYRLISILFNLVGIVSLSYDHLSKTPEDRYETVGDTAQTSIPDYDYPEISNKTQKFKSSQGELNYSYPEVTSSHKDVPEHFYEPVPQDRRNMHKPIKNDPLPYVEVSPSAKPKLTGKAPPRPSFKPNEKASDRLQGLNDLVASLEDIKVLQLHTVEFAY